MRTSTHAHVRCVPLPRTQQPQSTRQESLVDLITIPGPEPVRPVGCCAQRTPTSPQPPTPTTPRPPSRRWLRLPPALCKPPPRPLSHVHVGRRGARISRWRLSIAALGPPGCWHNAVGRCTGSVVGRHRGVSKSPYTPRHQANPDTFDRPITARDGASAACGLTGEGRWPQVLQWVARSSQSGGSVQEGVHVLRADGRAVHLRVGHPCHRAQVPHDHDGACVACAYSRAAARGT